MNTFKKNSIVQTNNEFRNLNLNINYIFIQIEPVKFC